MSAAYSDAFTADPVLYTALQDLIRVHAPEATLIAALGGRVLTVKADGPVKESGTALVPPDSWLEGGELAWITHDGALLGLLWSQDTPVADGAVQLLTLLLSGVNVGAINREAEMLLSQLPVPTAWLSADLKFRQVSRTFLELFGLASHDLSGQDVRDVLPDRPELVQQLERAAAGRSVHVSDELLIQNGQQRWVRGEAKPYFGAAAAGVLWTLQDVTPEYRRAGELQSLLETEAVRALVTPGGELLQASRGLNDLLQRSPGDTVGGPLWELASLGGDGEANLRGLLASAAAGRPMSTEVRFTDDRSVQLHARRSETMPELLVLEAAGDEARHPRASGVISQVLSLSDAATVLLDPAGRIQLVSEQVAKLMGIDSELAIGVGLSRLLQQIGVRLMTPQGEPLPMLEVKDLPLPFTREYLMVFPGGNVKQMEVRLSAVESSSSGAAGGTLLTLRDLTALRHAQAKIKHDALHDSLTGLFNRTGLRQFLKAEQTKAELGMLACIDVDGFSGLNAAMGRTAGDLLLIQIAARLNDLVTPLSGRAARLADDTFAVYLPDTTAEIGIQQIQSALLEPLRAGRRLVPVTFTIGAAAWQASGQDLLGDAEVALQHARREGRGQVTVFNPNLRDEEALTFSLEEDLRGAGSDQFTLLYQPAVSLKDGRAVGAEALLRWTHPTLGTISPGRFIPIASRSDLIGKVGEWVVNEALQGSSVIRRLSGYGKWRTSINLSAEEMHRRGTLDHLLPLLDKKPGTLDFELSAASLIEKSDVTLEVLDGLRNKGARLMVDDFGDGASSLTALTRFPLSGVKLHPTLTNRLPDSQKCIKLVQGTVDLAHSLGLTVTAVGVENYAQLDMLRDLGCDAAQGYAIAPPLSAADLAEWLKGR